jgi:hypothetical protein
VLERATRNENEEEAEPRTDVRVHLISSASQGYDAMEVEQTPRSVAPERQSVESLVSTLEDVHEAVGRWVPHKEKAPCPEDLFEYQGECYMASIQPPKLPQSVGQ